MPGPGRFHCPLLPLPPLVGIEIERDDLADRCAGRGEPTATFRETVMKRFVFACVAMLGLAGLVNAGSGTFRLDSGVVAPYASQSWTVTFYGSEQADILVVGDHNTDLDMFIYDENGNLILSDTNYTDPCAASFVPLWTGPFTIVVQNRCGLYNSYSISTN